jgi:hypothetical protein
LTVNRVRLRSSAPDGFGATYLFGSVADFFAGKADPYRQAFGSASTNFAVMNFGGFIQDHWSVSKRVTVDLGLRYDFEHLPAGFNQDANDFSPRIGVAYSPSHNWVLRAGFGIFRDRYVLAFLNRAIEKDGRQAFEQVAEGEAAATLFRQEAGGSQPVPSGAFRPSIFQSDSRLATVYSQQANFSVERLLATNLTVNANYLFVRGTKLARTRNTNLLPPCRAHAAERCECGDY